MDFSSVTTSSPYRKAWVETNFLEDQNLDSFSAKKYRSEKSLFYFNCAEKSLTAVQEIKYAEMNGSGTVMSSQTLKFVPTMLNDIVPDSTGELYLDTACGPVSERDKIRSANKKATAALQVLLKNSEKTQPDAAKDK